jgi:FkbM family methyltransferase
LSSRKDPETESCETAEVSERANLKRVVRHLKAAIEARAQRHYTRTGEDVILRYLFDSVGIAHPDYLDIGANDPVSGNNTYVFYRDGANGVCVEAHPDLARRIAMIRPRDVCLNLAVGVDGDGVADVHIFDAAGLSTTDAAAAAQRESLGTFRVVRTVSVPSCTINDVIAAHFDAYPALLSLDIEGLDYAVLHSLDDERFPIPVICAETVAYSETHIRTKDLAIADLLASRGYFLYADTFINSIFVRDAWFRAQASGSLW